MVPQRRRNPGARWDAELGSTAPLREQHDHGELSCGCDGVKMELPVAAGHDVLPGPRPHGGGCECPNGIWSASTQSDAGAQLVRTLRCANRLEPSSTHLAAVPRGELVPGETAESAAAQRSGSLPPAEVARLDKVGRFVLHMVEDARTAVGSSRTTEAGGRNRCRAAQARTRRGTPRTGAEPIRHS